MSDHDDERMTMADGWTDPDHPFDWLPPPDTDVAETAMDSIDTDPDILRRAAAPRVIQPTDFLPVSLEARQWETVMQVLADAPYRVAAPLIDGIRSQCMRGDPGG